MKRRSIVDETAKTFPFKFTTMLQVVFHEQACASIGPSLKATLSLSVVLAIVGVTHCAGHMTT